jgi:catalase
MHRTTPLRLAFAAGLAVFAASTPVLADDASLPEQVVDGMNKVWGSHPGIRSNHAKGIVVEGEFAPTKDAAMLSWASLFQRAAVPVTVRFSDATGVPTIADGDQQANPHGMAVKFHLQDGGEMDIVSNSLKFFPVATPEEFRDLFDAIAHSGPGAPKPSPIEQFLASHPSVGKAVATVHTPRSFGTESYNGVNAFIFVGKDGKRQPFRFRIDPGAGLDYLDEAQAAGQAPDFLMQELPARLAKSPVAFHLKAQLAEAGDPVTDATQPWPENRRLVDLGTITLSKVVKDNASAEKELLFLPQNLAEGIEPSEDPLIQLRNDAYAISFGRRSQ